MVLHAEKLLPGGSLFHHPDRPRAEVTVHVRPTHDVDAEIEVHLLLCSRNDQAGPSFAVQRTLVPHSRFCMYRQVTSGYARPRGSARFKLKDRVTRVPLWVNKTFTMDRQLLSAIQFEAAFEHVGSRVVFVLEVQDNCQVILHCESMEVCADVIQAMCAFLDVAELEVVADFLGFQVCF